MKLQLCLFLCLAVVPMCSHSVVVLTAEEVINDRPIIGVLAQELSRSLQGVYGEKYSSFIAASYVKFVEGAGARVVPIMINEEPSYYEEIVNSVNGILFPGGSNFYNESGYGRAGSLLYDLATSLNNRGDYFPVWGTCLGFEMLTWLMAGKQEPRQDCNAWDKADALHLEPDFRESRLFSEAPEEIIDLLAVHPVTANFHRYCLTKQGLETAGLTSSVRVLSTNVDWAGMEYVSALEAKNMPFYAVQFHPEKPLYEWNTLEKTIPHSATAAQASAYFARFLVNEARKNSHSFPSKESEESRLIYNYSPTYTGAHNLTFDQCYFF